MTRRTVGCVQEPDLRRDVPAGGCDETVAVRVLEGDPEAGDHERDAHEGEGASGAHDYVSGHLANRTCGQIPQ